MLVDCFIPLRIPHALTYYVPASFTSDTIIGGRVVVELGERKHYAAIVTSIDTETQPDPYLKPILEVIDDKPIVTEMHIRFWKWIAKYYMSDPGTVMHAALPSFFRLTSQTQVALSGEAFNIPFTEREQLLLQALQQKSPLSLLEIQEVLGIKTIMPLLKSLMNKGVIGLEEKIKNPSLANVKPQYTLSEQGKIWLSDGDSILTRQRKAPRQFEVLNFLATQSMPVSKEAIQKETSTSSVVIKSLLEKGLITLLKSSEPNTSLIDSQEFELSDEQEEAFRSVSKLFNEKQTVILAGVTGSGKTFVYFRFFKDLIHQGKQALFLVPEIALGQHLLLLVNEYFGKHALMYHSQQTEKEKVAVWNRVLSGEPCIVVGTRLSIFLPFTQLALVVVDEEYDFSHKQQQQSPKYHARDAAIFLSGLCKAKTILGAATPSAETIFNKVNDKFGYVEMKSRFAHALLPEVVLIDQKQSVKQKKMIGFLTIALKEEIERTVSDGGQVILFHSKSGYSPRLICMDCATVHHCPDCMVSMTYYKKSNTLKCHYCGRKSEIPVACLTCGSVALLPQGLGTEQLEETLKTIFPDFTIESLDSSVSRKKQDSLLELFHKGLVQILIGTRLLTKGFHFPGLKLTAVIDADSQLFAPDFRANERSYQLFEQLAGRAGRVGERGRLFIQTSRVDHPVFKYLLEGNYMAFLEEEMNSRKEFGYPPFSRIIRLTVMHKSADQLFEAVKVLSALFVQLPPSDILGPAMPFVPRVRGLWAMDYLFKLPLSAKQLSFFKANLSALLSQVIRRKDCRGLSFSINVDPQ